VRKVAQNSLSNKPALVFLYGQNGFGKTHLLHAIVNHLLQNNYKGKFRYLHCEEFINEFVAAMWGKTGGIFKKACRDLDCLLLDDIQYLIGNPRSEEEFSLTLNVLAESNKTVIITSNKAPKELPLNRQRLVSQFLSGIVVHIEPSDIEMRIEILKNHSSAREFNIPDDVICFLAENIKDVRGMLGASLSVEEYCISHGIPAKDMACIFPVHMGDNEYDVTHANSASWDIMQVLKDFMP